MNHMGQCVSDLERSRTFYEEALGFTYWRTLELDDSPSDKLLQLQPPLGFRACYLKQGSFVLELLHYAGEGAAAGAVPPAADERARAHPHLAQRRRHPRDVRAGRAVRRRGAARHRHRRRASSCATPTVSASSCCRWRTPSTSRPRADGARTARPRRRRHRRQPWHRQADRARLRAKGAHLVLNARSVDALATTRTGGRGARRARRAGRRRPVRPRRRAADRRAGGRRARAHRRAGEQHGRRGDPDAAAQADRTTTGSRASSSTSSRRCGRRRRASPRCSSAGGAGSCTSRRPTASSPVRTSGRYSAAKAALLNYSKNLSHAYSAQGVL